ncbi:MAG: FHA domain-containing protein, partial [Cyanobacteria bacterium]|nr:FHA domain-containing protein [Cyanobacteriota bacterium]MDW8203202.1 FHA domain-containing protein [Cyanobacteriota bacterium SKYGB_h_bin112]
MSDLLRLQLTWDEPADGTRRSPVLMLPIALGREFAAMPAQWNNQRVSRMVLHDSQISQFHALIECVDGAIVITDQGSRLGMLVNGTRQQRVIL